MTATLEAEFKSIEPALLELASNLNLSPEEVLRSAIESKKREWALKEVDALVANAEKSGFTSYNPNTFLDEVKERASEIRTKE